MSDLIDTTLYTEIMREKEELENRIAALNADLQAKREEDLEDFVAVIWESCTEIGIPVAKVVAMLMPQKTQKRNGAAGKPTYRDPNNHANVCGKGRPPPWFKDGMKKANLNPDDKNDRIEFRRTHLERIPA